ncbi:Cna B-type domain-containing protein [Levyella massiliensis]|uniref:Cna B-type domain-containing protein n=1 Tax=Levyella massiliensis TaxID=938289 RepID=UPI000367AC7D|nr:Cna B-type domain-containing protein [Levyella massiliensis]
MKRKNRWGVLLSLLLIVSMVAGMLPHNVEAEKVADPPGVNYDAEGNLIIENQKALQDKIEEATALGVTVNVTDQKNDPIYVGKATALTAAKTTIESNNTDAIKALDNAINAQKKNNMDYQTLLKDSFKDIQGTEWTFGDIQNFILTDKEKQLSKDKQLALMVQRMSAASVVTPSSETKLIKTNLKNPGYLTEGDTLRYEKVLQDSATDKWVDFKLTIKRIDLVHTPYKEGEAKKTELKPNKNHSAHDIDPAKPLIYYSCDDLTIQVDFLKHGTDEPISIIPILVFVDVDVTQAVKLESPASHNALKGKKLDYDATNDKFYDAIGDDDGNPDGDDRDNWVMFSTGATTGFTYTFYTQRKNFTGVIQGIGGDSVKYTPPAKPKSETVNVTRIKQPIYHQVRYAFVGDIPQGIPAPVDENNYLFNTPRAKSPELSKQTDSQGTWTFSGWCDDEKLTKPITDQAPVTKDEIIYGKWSLNPYTSVSVQKIWKGRAAKEVEIQLLANGKVKETKKLTANDQWKWTFNQLLTNDDNENPIAYTVTETPLKGYQTTITGDAAGGFIITNRKKTSFTPPTISSSSSESSSLPLSSDSTSDVPDIPQTPEDPPETSTPTPTPTPTPSPTPTPTPMPTPSPMPTPTPKPTPTPTKTNVNAPKTGEMQNHILDVALFGFVATAISLVILKKRKSTH